DVCSSDLAALAVYSGGGRLVALGRPRAVACGAPGRTAPGPAYRCYLRGALSGLRLLHPGRGDARALPSALHLRTFNGRKADQSGTTARSHGRSPGRAEHGFPGASDGHHRSTFLRTHAVADRGHPGLAAERYSGAALDHGGRRIPAVAADAAAAQIHLVTRLD